MKALVVRFRCRALGLVLRVWRKALGKSEFLGSPVVPFYPFSFWVPLLKPNSRKKGALIVKGLLGNLDSNGANPTTS